MKDSLLLTIASWAAVLLMMAVICWQLANVFAPEYPATSVRYTPTAFKALQYEKAQAQYDKEKAEKFIRSLADGNLR